MPYEITISGIDTVFRKCIDWVTCKVDTPSTSNARTNFVGNYMNISGFIGTDEVTIDLYNWAVLAINDSNVFRNVKVTVKDANDNVIEKVSFPNAFVEFYRESYLRDKGLGKFDLQLKQKIDKNGDVGVSDSSADEKVKSAAGLKTVESILGNASKSDILDTGVGKITDGVSEPNINPITGKPKGTLQNMANEIRQGGLHPASRNQRTIAVGMDDDGNIFAGSSNYFDRGQKAVAENLGVKIVNPHRELHAEEELMAEIDNLISVGTSKRAPCGLTEHNCLGQLNEKGIDIDNLER